ncbi:MAG: 2-amino-4-oxopentanoate thiolase subunit OrtA [Filifactoraceae bacterium]
MAEKGDWVLIHSIVFTAEQRAPQVPDDTKKVPLEMWVKGYLQNDANIGDIVKVETRTGRIEEGKLLEVDPFYKHDFGKFVPEILQIGEQVREILFGGENND